MAQIPVTSGTEFAVKWALLFAALIVIVYISRAIDPTVQYVLSGTALESDMASFIVAFALVCCAIAMLPSDTNHVAAVSTFFYVLEVHRIALRWKDCIAVSNLFAAGTGFETWYPATEIARLPRNERRDAIVDLAKRTNRLIPPPSQDDREQQRRRRHLIMLASCIAWVMFVAIGSTRQGPAFDTNGFVRMGVLPALVPWVVLLAIRASTGGRDPHAG